MYISLFSIHMAFLCSSLLLLLAAVFGNWILKNYGTPGLLCFYLLAALRMMFPLTPYLAWKVPAPFFLNIYQSIADIPLIISHRRVRFSTVFLALWAGVSLLLLLGYLVFLGIRRRRQGPSTLPRTHRWALFLWTLLCICFCWNFALWLAWLGLQEALANWVEPPKARRKRPAILLASCCLALIAGSYATVFLSHYEPGIIDYLSYEAVADQTFIEPLPYQSFALHENGYSTVISREEMERLADQGVPVIWAK